MERNTFFCNLGLYIKSVLVLILLLGGSGSAWADRIIYDGTTKTVSGWTLDGMSVKSYSTPYWLYKNGTGGTITSDNTISFSANEKLVITAKNYGSLSTEVPQIVVKISDDNFATYTTAGTFTTKETIPNSNVELKTNITGNYKVQIVCDYVYVYSITIINENPYKTPTSFALESFTATSAKFTWGREDEVTAFQMQYIKQGDADSTTIEIGNYLTTTLNDLSTGTEYKAKLRSNYDGVHYSEWTEEITFTPRAEIETTINDENTTTNQYIPFYASSASTSTSSQFIIPSSQLSEISGRQITKLVLYCSSATKSFGTAQWEVYLKETDNTTYSSYSFESWGTKVFNSAILSVSDYMMEITLNTPFNYSGNNLMIGFKQTVSGTGSYSSFVCVSTSDQIGYNLYNGSNTYLKHYPKMTITSVPITTAPVQMDNYGFTTFASPYPLDLTTSNMPDDLTAYRAAEIDAGKSIVRFTSDINQTVQANTGILLKGKENTTYLIPVVASGSALEDNALLVNEEGGTFTADEDSTYFAMKKNSNPLTFGTFNPSTTAIPSNKAYLKVLTSSLPSGARTLRFVFDDNETTGIKNVDAQKTSSKDIYFNLNGQRVAKPTKGMYISNGKKYIVK